MNFLAQHTVVKYFYEGLWRDEAFSWAMAAKGLDLLPLTARDVHPPLYYLLLSAWMQVAGSSEVAIRSLSVLFFLGTLWVVWRFMVDLLGVPARRAGLYLVLFALNPILSYYAVEARMYSLLAFLAALSFYAHLTKRPFLYVISTTAGLYTHYFMFLVIGSQIAGAVLAGARRAKWRRQVLLMAMPVVLLAPWLVATVLSKEEFGGEYWVEAPGWRFGLHVLTAIYTGHDPDYGFLERAERWLFALSLLPLVLWSLWAGYRAGERRPVDVYTALWALLPPGLIFALAFVKPMFVPRFLIFSAIGLLLLLVTGLERTTPRLRLALFALLCALSIHYQVVQAHRHSKGAFRETITQIASQAGPEDLLYVRKERDFLLAQYYFDASRVFVLGRRYEDIKENAGKVLIPSGKVLLTMPQPRQRVYILDGDVDVTVVEAEDSVEAGGSARPPHARVAAAGGRQF